MSNITMTVDELLATAEGKGGSTAVLSDGVYGGVVVGYSIQHNVFTDPKTGEVRESDGAKFIIQIVDDEGKRTHITTTTMKASLHEKSTLRKELASWMKQSDPKGIIDALTSAGIITNNEFSWTGFIGRKVGVMLKMTASKKDATKLYPTIASLIPCKANLAIEAEVAELPDWMFRESLHHELMEGFTVKEKQIVTAPVMNGTQATAQQQIPGFTQSAEAAASTTPVQDDLPF